MICNAPSSIDYIFWISITSIYISLQYSTKVRQLVSCEQLYLNGGVSQLWEKMFMQSLHCGIVKLSRMHRAAGGQIMDEMQRTCFQSRSRRLSDNALQHFGNSLRSMLQGVQIFDVHKRWRMPLASGVSHVWENLWVCRKGTEEKTSSELVKMIPIDSIESHRGLYEKCR